MNRVLSASLRAACGLFVLAWAAFAQDSLVNGTFTSTLTTGWTLQGTATIVGAQGNIVPLTGANQVQIASGTDVNQFDGAPNTQAFPDVSVAGLETALNIPSTVTIAAALPSVYGTPAYGSAIYQTFTALAGATLTFNWNFATNETVHVNLDNAALYTLQAPGAATAQVFELADNSSAFTFQATTGTTAFQQMTGYSTVTILLPTAGTYTLGFIALQTTDDNKSSATYINNVTLTGGRPPAPTPVPAAWSLGLLGFAFIATYSVVRRLRRVS